MQTVKHAIISAAGLGSRLDLNIPKCLVEINGRSIISYQLESLSDVPNIRVVVGFMENEVINHVLKIRDDVLFVRNPKYTSTSNAYSLWLATNNLKTDFLAVDGDLLIPKKDFKAFLDNVNPKESLVGVTRAKTEDAIFTDFNEKDRMVNFFTREKNYKYEWTGLAYLSGIEIDKKGKYVFEIIQEKLPVRGFEIVCYEVDTPSDLNLARNNFVY